MGTAATFLLIALGVVGCSSRGQQRPTQVPTVHRVSVDRVCAGLFAAEGGKALERVLESTKFRIMDDTRDPDVRTVSQAMENAYRSGNRIRQMPQSTCEISGSDGGGHVPTAMVRFTASSKRDDFLSGNDRGVRVSTRERKIVYLEYDCVSPRVGSTQDIPLRIRLLFQDRWQASKGDPTLRPDYLTATHSAALAVAKELRCVDDGGLPARAEDLPAG